MERYERAFLAASAVALVIFLCALGYGSVAMGVHLPSHGAMIHYEAGQKLRMVLRHTAPFDHPGVYEVAPGKSAGCGISRRTRMTRVAFILFILLIAVGFHHQFVDPGVSQGMKFTVAGLTFAIFFPSLMTAFAVMYALEIAGRRRGGNGRIGWFFKIPWSDPSVAAQVLAMIAFLLGGISGLMNGSFTMNMEIHNTAFIPGHFYLTIGRAVALSYVGIAYWLIPYLERRELWSRRTALVQAFLYFFGVMIFSHGPMAGGVEGMPRRTDMVHAA